METPKTSDAPSAELQLPCRHLRCKEMYYQGSEEDEFASGAYWLRQLLLQESQKTSGKAGGLIGEPP